MAYSINTNVVSLQAQEYLRVSSDFQQKTINRVTSGLRIINSGDDAAGLAIAKGFRSDRAVIGQGVRNANDGLSTLQTIDGGINNISQLLDRARTLAAQSASGTFSGDRTVLDSEFQTVLEEIDRQSQSIGRNTGGIFAKNLNVFIGGGRGADNAETISNGSIAIDLSSSTVDTRSLSLKGLQVTGAAATDVDEILADTTNTASQSVSGYTDFYFRGAGFSDDDRIRVQVNLTGVDDANELVTAFNGAIESAGSGGTGAAAAFKEAGSDTRQTCPDVAALRCRLALDARSPRHAVVSDHAVVPSTGAWRLDRSSETSFGRDRVAWSVAVWWRGSANPEPAGTGGYWEL